MFAAIFTFCSPYDYKCARLLTCLYTYIEVSLSLSLSLSLSPPLFLPPPLPSSLPLPLHPQELLYVVPFVAKVLESCAESRVFKPPNPWTMAIMSVLSELHSAPDLKLNLRFEVEVLCKHLNMEIAVSMTQIHVHVLD